MLAPMNARSHDLRPGRAGLAWPPEAVGVQQGPSISYIEGPCVCLQDARPRASGPAPTRRGIGHSGWVTAPHRQPIPRLRGVSAPRPERGGASDFHGRLTPEYAPRRDGEPDPGEVVWVWVPYEEDPAQGKDRPVVVVGRDRDDPDLLVALMLSSKEHDGDPHWHPDPSVAAPRTSTAG